MSLLGVNTANAQGTWTSFGFTGTVIFDRAVPPQYKIGWQSLTTGTQAPCTSGVHVDKSPPSP